jgi:hypothetical protein
LRYNDGVRPVLDPFLVELVRDLRTADPGRLRHLDAERILFVAGAARLESRASIRPLTFGGSPPRYEHGAFAKPHISIRSTPMLYEICLRPRFFLAATPDERLAILAHELWHIAPEFDGTLARARRHVASSAGALEREVRAIVARARDSEARAMLSYTGEIEMRAWLSRPPSRIPLQSSLRRDYDERDLHRAILELR